ncbi:hypothetical protein QUF90_00075 [Desulfococcaceae bacterium HSG9]|nr:hypothetical protein [Desulfococcaceae bacterium HSG9]
MTEYFFRAEGVNLSPTVYDTSDISTIRGAGFYLLTRVGALARKYKQQLITEGASSAVFAITTENPDAVRQEMLCFLYKDKTTGSPIREMMFLVEFIENTGDIPKLMAKLLGKIRMAQMQTASFRLFRKTLKSGYFNNGKIMGFDALNRVLPAHQDTIKGGLSDFTHSRREQGKALRDEIYKELLADVKTSVPDYPVTNSLQVLAEDDKQGNLSGKIAYIYIDGNKFGALQQDFSVKQFREYDIKLQGFKKKFLAGILELVIENKSFLTTDHRVRLETLLWGGDELKLIVPAWMGWKVASLFFRLAESDEMKMETKINNENITCDLTYAMGLVFAHRNNPVRNIGQIAEELAETVKKELSEYKEFKYPAYTRASGNRMHYAVLESLESFPSDYADFIDSYYSQQDSRKLSLSPSEMDQLKAFAELCEEYFSHSSVHKIARTCSEKPGNEYYEALQRALDVCEADGKGRKKLTAAIEDVTGTVFVNEQIKKGSARKNIKWRQIAELWDYLKWKES